MKIQVLTGRKARGLTTTECTVTGELSPTGEFSIGVIPPSATCEPHRFLERERRAEVEELVQVNAHGAALALDAELRAPLISTSASNSKKEPVRARKGSRGMSGKARRKVKGSVYLLEERYGRDNLSFLTLTLPGLSSEGLRALCANWGPIVHRFKAWLNSRLKSHGLEGRYVYCTEVQEKRLERTGDIALHLHMVFVGRKTRYQPWVVTPNEIREAWRRALQAHVEGLTDDSPLVVNIQRVEKTVVSYLGKYLSKGASVTRQIVEAGRGDELPSEWWGSGMPVKTHLKKRTTKLHRDACDLLWEMCREGAPDEILWARPVVYEAHDGAEFHVGWIGQVAPSLQWELANTHGTDQSAMPD